MGLMKSQQFLITPSRRVASMVHLRLRPPRKIWQRAFLVQAALLTKKKVVATSSGAVLMEEGISEASIPRDWG
jgi:hypothetical protein